MRPDETVDAAVPEWSEYEQDCKMLDCGMIFVV